MQVTLLRKKVRKYRCLFKKSIRKLHSRKRVGTAIKEEGGEGESPTEKKSRPPHRKSLRFIPFTRLRRASIRLLTNQFVSPPTSARFIVVIIIVPHSHPFATLEIAMLWKFYHQAACRKVA